MPDQILLDIMLEHLPYEIDMLRGTYSESLQILRNRPASETFGQQTIRFALLEAFCIHARGLLDFFSNNRSDPTDAVASDFTTGYVPTFDQNAEPLKSLRVKLNKQIFHLTKNRTIVNVDKFQMPEDAESILKQLELAIAHFINCLAPDFNSFRCRTSPATFITTLPASSRTSTFETYTLLPRI